MTLDFLPGAERYYVAAAQKREDSKTQSRGFRLIERANDVSVFDVLQDFFDLYLPRDGESFKSKCPFSYEHEDGGLDKGWRTYPGTNSSFCFPMHGFLPPVRLVSLKFEERPIKAAERILRKYDLLKPHSYKKRFNALLLEQEQKDVRRIGNPQHAMEALNLALDQIPGYSTHQFHPDVMRAMEIILSALDVAIASDDQTALRTWYTKARTAMTNVVERQNHHDEA